MSRALVWVTGARGLAGQALTARLAAAGHEVLATGHEVDIAARDALVLALAGRRPSCIFNAAAYTAVDRAESEPDAAFRTNAEGAGRLAELAAELGADLVHLSSDYVLAGAPPDPLPPDAAPAPAGVYAQSKHAGEARVLATAGGGDRRVIVLRTSRVFGHGARSFVSRVMEMAAERDELRIVADQWSRPTAAADLADAAIALALGDLRALPAGIHHFANRGHNTWHDFACAIVESARAHGLPVVTRRVVPITSAELSAPAPRPNWSVLDCAILERALEAHGRPVRTWREALDAHVSRARRDQ